MSRQIKYLINFDHHQDCLLYTSISCEPVKKSKKLLCFQVKVGSQTRQIVSGIKAYYKPEDTIGMKVMVLTNLKPAKLAGMMSEGMLLCACLLYTSRVNCRVWSEWPQSGQQVQHH